MYKKDKCTCGKEVKVKINPYGKVRVMCKDCNYKMREYVKSEFKKGLKSRDGN